jgi:TolB-like protein/class 3 adenylate cyclase
MTGERVVRRLAAILAADVVGYSRLVGRDENGTVIRLKAHRTERLEPTLARHGGRLVKLMGDGALVEFPSAVDALNAAIAFQQAVTEANRDQPEDTRIVFRIGLHLGDLIVEGEDLYGDGVNVAARLEAEAPPGGIVVSRAIREAVEGRLKAKLHALGELALKNIERPIRAFRVEWDAADWKTMEVDAPKPAIPTEPTTSTLALPDKPSIAVLPFQNMSGDPEQEYFCDGITEDITTALSRFSSIFVIAQDSSFTYRGKVIELKQLGHDLGVRYVVEGSVRKALNKVRIAAQLIQIDTKATLWADRYDGDLNDIFALQDDISRRIVGTIAPEIGLAEQTRVERMPPEALHAYDLAMRSAHLCRRGRDSYDRELVHQAKELAERAVVADSTSVSAYYALAEATSELAELWNFQGDMDVLLEGAAAAGEMLRNLDPTSYAGYYQIGHAAIRRRRAAEALSNLRRAHELNPNDSRTLQFLGWAEFNVGLAETAKQHVELALRLSPRDPQRYLSYWVLAFAAFIADAPLEGVAWARKAVEENTNFFGGYGILAACLVQAGQADAARAAIDFLLLHQPEYIRSRLAGNNYFGLPELGERYTKALRAAAGKIDDANAGPPK